MLGFLSLRLGSIRTAPFLILLGTLFSLPAPTTDYFVNPDLHTVADAHASSNSTKHTPLPTYTAAPTCATEETHAPGDLNGDGEVDAEDLLESWSP
jgi:hypothetical protein